MNIPDKRFQDLTENEARRLVRQAVEGAHSEDEVRRNLSAAGFHGDEASIRGVQQGGRFSCSVIVTGPRGMEITV